MENGMNRTAIEWTDYTWNPVTGCWGPGGTAEKPNRCPYCYAQKVTNRFPGNFNRWHDDPFVPKFAMGEQLLMGKFDDPAKVKKPSKIFVCSMADLFGAWVPSQWIGAVLETIRACPWHTFQLLTKNPERLANYNPFPGNVWVGTTVTNQADADERLPWLVKVEAPIIFISHEPLLGSINFASDEMVAADFTQVDWGIIGAMTGPGAVKVDRIWVRQLMRQYHMAGVPVFLKNNLNWPEKIQEWPHGQ
jgi:protein gp37